MDRKRTKKNPVPPSQLEKAKMLYERFSGHEGRVVASIDKFTLPDVMCLIGEVDFIGYTTIRDGVVEKYIHRFRAKSRPLFTVTPDGKQIVVLGGAYDFTERGIVDK